MSSEESEDSSSPSLGLVLREWGRIGCVGFGGPPTHIRLLRQLCVEQQRWMNAAHFEDAVATCNLLPGPASTQLAIFCAWRLRGWRGAVVGGAAFIVPGLLAILGLSALFLASAPPRWALGAGAGAGAAVAAVAVHAGSGLVPDSWRRRVSSFRFAVYLFAGGVAAATLGPWLVVVLIGCGLLEVGARHARPRPGIGMVMPLPILASGAATAGGLIALCWVAFKVGALSYGGGFVIIPLMQADAVHHYHWMTNGQFLNAVALGQITPGPVVQTVAAVGYAAAGVIGGLLAALIAFAPSFLFVLAGARHFDQVRQSARAKAFLGGAGPAAIGAILGTAVPVTRALTEPWQFGLLAAAAVMILALRRQVVSTLLSAALVGMLIAVAGGPLPH